MDVDRTCNDSHDPQITALCACRAVLEANSRLYTDFIKQMQDYTQSNQKYQDYLKAKSQHLQERNDEETRWNNAVMYGPCQTVVDQCNELNADWTRKSGSGIVACDPSSFLHGRAYCKYTPEFIQRKMAQWDVTHPAPPEVGKPIVPGTFSLPNIECCSQSFANISGDMVQFKNVIQECQLEIDSKIANTRSDEMSHMSHTLAPIPTTLPVSTTPGLVVPYNSSNHTLIYVLSGATLALLIVCIVIWRS